MRRIFWGFCRNWFHLDPLHYLSSRSDFGFEFAEIFVIEKRLPDSASQGVDDFPTRWVRESAFECLKENSASRRVGDSPTPRVGESLWSVGESLFKFFKIYHPFKRLNQPFKRSIWQKRSQWCNVLSPLIYLRFEKNCIYRQSCQLPDSASRGLVFRLRISPKIRR